MSPKRSEPSPITLTKKRVRIRLIWYLVHTVDTIRGTKLSLILNRQVPGTLGNVISK